MSLTGKEVAQIKRLQAYNTFRVTERLPLKKWEFFCYRSIIFARCDL